MPIRERGEVDWRETASTDRQRVLLVHSENPQGLTDYELAGIMERQQNSAGKRRSELRDAGLIEWTPERRPAPSGALATVWRITPLGMEAAREI